MADWLDDVVAPRESGGRPNIGWGNTDLTPWLRAGKTVYGFPDWPGLPGPEGNSTAAGLYQITKTNWKNLAPRLGVNDFSPASQRKVADEIMRTQGRSAWAASEPGYKSGLRSPGRPEGYYDSSLNVTLRPDKPEFPFAALDTLLAGKPIGDAEGGEDHPLAMIGALLGAGPKEGGEAKLPQPETPAIAPQPGPTSPQPSPAEQFALPPAEMPQAAPSRVPGMEVAQVPPMAPPEPQAPSPAFDPGQALDQLLGQAAPAPAAAPPQPQLPTVPRDIPPATPPREPPKTADVGTGIPISLDRSPVQMPPDTLLDHLLKGATDIGQFIAGGAEHAAAGALNTLRMPGQPIVRTQIPMAEGARAAEGFATFATGGLASSLFPGTRMLGQGARQAGRVAGDVSREAAGAVPSVMASEQGATRLPGARGGPPRPPREPVPERGPAPILDPPIEGEGLKQTVTRIDDALHRVLTNNTADKIEMSQWLKRLPKVYQDKKVSAAMADDVERRMVDPNVPLAPVTQEFLDGPGKRLVETENRIGNRLRTMLGDDAKYADLPSAREGYAHRITEGAEGEKVLGRLDPERGRTTDVITGRVGGERSLSKFAPSMQSRTPMFVLQDERGRRLWTGENLEKRGFKYGQKAKVGDIEWTIKPPTMAEMEANTKVRYVHDYVGNLATNVLRLQRIERHVELLQDLKTELTEKGMFHPEGAKGLPPATFRRVDLPQLRGYADPKIANVLNDFWGGAKSDLAKFLNNVNRFLIGSLFVTPVPHIQNVAAHWAIGRGWDWLSIPAYVRGAQSGAKALNAVWNLTPEYQRMLREGSGLLYGDTAMENFYNMLMKQTWQEQLRNPEVWAGYAKQVLGKPYRLPMDALTAVKDLVKAEYRWSRKTLWAANDMLMLQRQFELERKGMPTRQAIFEAERDIPNYRIPTEVLGRHDVSEGLKNPSIFNFGRYHYGLVRSLGEMMKDLVSPKATLQQRWEAAGKLTVLGTIGILAYPALDSLLQKVTGNEDATVRRFGPFGPLAAGGYLARNAYQKFTGDSVELNSPLGQPLLPGDKEWSAMVAPLLSPAPTMAMIPMVTGNIDWMGRPVIDPRASPTGMAYQAGEAVARQLSPLDMAMRSMEEGGGTQALGGLVGLTLPRKTPGPSPRTERMLRKRARRREQRDPVQNWFEEKLDSLRPSIGGP